MRATIFVETDSQKQIVVGKSGSVVKKIGTRARPEIEHLLGHPVFLDLKVKSRPRWRRDEAMLERLGHLMTLLVLFDVDGTLLLRHDPLATRAFLQTLSTRFGVDLPEDAVTRVDHPGQTSLRIARLVLRDAGLGGESIDSGLPDWCTEYSDRYLELLRRDDSDELGAASRRGRRRSPACRRPGSGSRF